jgi:hypothetical protein
MNEQNHEKKFLDNIRETLDADIDNLDAGIRSRLTQARHRALEVYKEKGGDLRWGFKLPVAGLATALVIFLVTTLFFNGLNGNRVTNNIEDFDILASQDNLKLYENLDFYAWLAEETENAG